MSRLRQILAAALLCVLPLCAHAASWWSQDWQFRKEVSFDLTPQAGDVAGSPNDVPVLIRLSIANFSYFNDAKPDGSDFRVVAADDKTPLKSHFERYDVQNQMAFLWVRVPRLTGGAKTDKLYVYYGNPKAPPGDMPADTYDADQALVLHFGEPDGAPKDATAYKNNPASSSAEAVAASLIGGGTKFSGTQSVVIPASASLGLVAAKGFTASAWIKPAGTADGVVLALRDGARELSLGISGGKVVARLKNDAAVATAAQTTGEFAASQWHHVAVRVGDGKLAVFVDGAEAGSAPATAVDLGGKLSIGADADGHNGFVGELDEVDASHVARTPEWIKASAHGQLPDALMVVYGADGQREGGNTSYFATIAKNLTVDGWVVIVICLSMLVLAVIVMIGKAIFLSRVEGANKRFIVEFRKLSGDPRALDRAVGDASADDADDSQPVVAVDKSDQPASLVADQTNYTVSTLFALYHHGIAELNKRLSERTAKAQEGQREGNAATPIENFVLSPQSIAAIHAALDSTLARQQQRLSSQMVLLTIAISGGPFLGLLGTVIGVMITFAAIALSGDVNVNAIAPGTAAALAATVAGLAVAIPSLFGYNWLNTRIKVINVDNRVFVDEFITRLAEQYS